MPPFNAPKHRDYLHSLQMYAATATILSSLGWGREGSADMLFEKNSGDPAVLIIVGKVVDDRLFCGPQGNWSIGNQYGNLKTAKYQFSIGRPDEDVFAKDYDAAFKTLSRLQSSVAASTNREHLLIGESDRVSSIKFSANMFETRPSKPVVTVSAAVRPRGMQGALVLSDLSTTPSAESPASEPVSDDTLTERSDSEKATMDATTAHWPVPDNMKEDLEAIMGSHKAQPLPVYKDDRYVTPTEVNSTLPNALVEVHFRLRHYKIFRKDAEKCIDSFSGLIEQIVVLKSGSPRPASAYKRKNLLDGPFRPKPYVADSPNSRILVAAPENAIAGPSNTKAIIDTNIVPPNASADGLDNTQPVADNISQSSIPNATEQITADPITSAKVSRGKKIPAKPKPTAK